MTITIEISPADEARLREAQARQDREALKGMLGELAVSILLPASPLDHAVSRLRERTPDERRRDREDLLALAPTPRPLAIGESALDAVFGKWPGDETDEQIHQALDAQ